MADGSLNPVQGLSISDKLGAIETWVSDYKSGNQDRLSGIDTPEKCSRILNGIIEGMSLTQRRKNNDVRRDKAISIMADLINLSDEVSKATIGYSQKALDFLSDYHFDGLDSLEKIDDFLSRNTGELVWNTLKFEKFLLHISKFDGYFNRKTEILINLLENGHINSCGWTEDSLTILADIVKKTKKTQLKRSFKILFNRLPRIQKIRRKGDGRTNDVWNTLYFESKMDGRSAARGYGNSHVADLDRKMGPLAINHSPSKL